ncbi:tetratricopeptide repeat (TPR)-like superfamily protein [Wolffia australiana]
MASSIASELYPSQDDLLYEEEILRNPFSLKLWWRYLRARADAPFKKRSVIYERALKALPGSYKLWHAYLRERIEIVRPLPVAHSLYDSLNNTFERALVTMHKMPRIWIMFLSILTDQRLITRARRTFDRALRALPVTQHDRIWEPFLKFVSLKGIPIETSLRVYRRYLMYDPSHIEDFIEFLVNSELWQEAAERLAAVLNDDEFSSIKGKTKHQLWLELCDLLTKHATEVSGMKVDAIIRGGIKKFTDEVGRLWTSLADYYVRRGLYEKARDVFEEGITTVITVRDFSVIFESYAQFEQSTLAAKIETLDLEEDEEQEQEQEQEEGDARTELRGRESDEKFAKRILKGFWLNDDDDTDLRIARFENLLSRRPELLNSVLLRQNPHNVEQWHRRVKLFEGNPTKQILTYTEAVRTVDPMKAVGKPHTLWVAFARLYETHNDINNARVIFEKATQASFKSVDHLASIWCEWAEMELKHNNFKGARELLTRATAEPSVEVKRRVAADGGEPVQMKLHRSLRVWSLYVDLEEGLDNLEATRAIYERILDLRIATPQIIINYAYFLEEHKYFEDSFKVYERGVKIFKYPHVKDIWVTYLTKFVARYGKSKLERSRELFEHAIEKAPPEEVKPLYLQYAKLEEEHGLAKRAMKVYDQAVKTVPNSEKMSMYEIYIARAAKIFGVPKTREIYEQAIESGLPDNDVKTMCLKYAELEKSLGELARAHAIFRFASQFADPRIDEEFWQKWNDFEVQHGNEETFREMRRIKRSVLASFSQTHLNLAENLMQRAEQKLEELKSGDAVDGMAALERQVEAAAARAAPQLADGGAARMLGFVSAGVESQDSGKKAAAAPAVNAEEIELPDEDEVKDGEEDESTERVVIAQKAVPDAVYGELARVTAAVNDENAAPTVNGTDAPMGALERIKRLRRQ